MVYIILFVVALAVIIILVPRKAAIGLGGAAVLVATIIGLIYMTDSAEQRTKDSVGVSLVVDSDICQPPKILKYQVENLSEETVYRVYFRYTVYRIGYSSPVSKSYGNEVTEDKILAPGATQHGCISLPHLNKEISHSELEFRIDHKRVWLEPPIH
ncbi:MAG: hypothetical protein MI867_29385 [Pseudomonadales bacterium]|nr:hypothetical protein [Pseudomonadales bacterium]